MQDPDPQDLIAIGHLFVRYAQAIDEKNFPLLDAVFTPDASLRYRVGPHDFECRGDEAAKAFGAFLELCYWTNHLIAAPSVQCAGDRAVASTRVIANHLQRESNGGMNHWILRGSYHDRLIRRAGIWRIDERVCLCEEEGKFVSEGVDTFPTLAWTGGLDLPAL